MAFPRFSAYGYLPLGGIIAIALTHPAFVATDHAIADKHAQIADFT